MFTIDELLQHAYEKKASDLHITVGIPPKLRIYGELFEMECDNLLPNDIDRLIQPLLADGNRTILEEKGEVNFSYSIKEFGRIRVNIFKQRGYYALVIRLIETNIPTLESLSVPQSVIDVINKKCGLILVTGPTGSGKSTTLASLINEINENQNAHIITLEDPIEYLHSHKKSIVHQREIGVDTKDYKQALYAALHEDPDVILVGELRDLDTISIALTAVESGHLVLSTLHTTGVLASINYLINAFPSEQQQKIHMQLASVLEMVISQLLIPTQDKTGRVAAYEVLCATTAIKNLICEGKVYRIGSMIQTNSKLGMQVMDDAIYELYLKRKIDAEKAIAYAKDPIALQKKLHG